MRKSRVISLGSTRYARPLTAVQQKAKDKAQKAEEKKQYKSLYRGLKWLYKASKGYEEHKPLDNYEMYELDRAFEYHWAKRKEYLDK